MANRKIYARRILPGDVTAEPRGRNYPPADVGPNKESEHEDQTKHPNSRINELLHVMDLAVNRLTEEQLEFTENYFANCSHDELAHNGSTIPNTGTVNMAIGRLERASRSRAESSGEGRPSSRGGIWGSSPKQKVILACLAVSNMVNFMPQSLIAPFFPKEASLKGVSNTTTGWIFGEFALVQVLMCPLFGFIMPSTGPKFLFMSGSFVAGVSSCLFGILDQVSVKNGPEVFITLCFLTRSFLALGCAAISTAILALGAVTFPDNPSTVLGIIETACGVGLMIGPAFGGLLYEVGGFHLPFIVMGGVILISMPLYLFILPNTSVHNTNASKGVMLRILKIPTVWVIGLAVFAASVSWIILEPTLEPHLRQFDLSPGEVGLVFLMLSGTYAIVSPFLGWAADKLEDSNPLMIVGFLFTAVNLILLGPSPVTGSLQDYSKLWLNLLVVGLIGVGFSLAAVPTLDKIVYFVEKNGIPCDLAATGTVSGYWYAVYSMGEFLGPVLAGLLVDTSGFSWCMTYFAALCVLTALVLCCLWVYEHSSCCGNSREERRPLLKSVNRA